MCVLQVLKAIEQFPVHFHAGMIGDLQSPGEGDAAAAAEEALEKVELEAWSARLRSLRVHLEKDLQTLARTTQGYHLLQDQPLDFGW